VRKFDIKLSTSLPILEGCLSAACDKRENGKSISSIDTSQASIMHRAKTDSDLASPPGCYSPATQQASQGILTWSAARHGPVTGTRQCVRTRVPVTRSEARSGPRMRLPGRLGVRGGASQWRPRPDWLEDRGRRTGRCSGPTTS
jgi:hypothetical protein